MPTRKAAGEGVNEQYLTGHADFQRLTFQGQRRFVQLRIGGGAMMARQNKKIAALPDGIGARAKRDSVQICAGIVLCLCAFAPTEAHAYLDPGTGTFALQGLIAGVAGGVISIRSYWRRIGGLFRRRESSESWPERPPSGSDA
jgi:hypothetical protein